MGEVDHTVLNFKFNFKRAEFKTLRDFYFLFSENDNFLLKIVYHDRIINIQEMCDNEDEYLEDWNESECVGHGES